MTSLVTGLPLDLQFRTKGQLAMDICADAFADGLRFDFICGDEVYGSCTQLRAFLEGRGQAYALRVPSNFHLTPECAEVTAVERAMNAVAIVQHPDSTKAAQEAGHAA